MQKSKRTKTEEQIKEKINAAVETVGAELVQYKGSFTGLNRSAASGKIFSDDFFRRVAF